MSKFFTLCAALAVVWSVSARADDTCDVVKRIVAAELAEDQGALADDQGHARILPPDMQCTLEFFEDNRPGFGFTMWRYSCETAKMARTAANAQAERMTASVAACYPQPGPLQTSRAGGLVSTVFTVAASRLMDIRVLSDHSIHDYNMFVAGFDVEHIVKKEGEK